MCENSAIIKKRKHANSRNAQNIYFEGVKIFNLAT